MAKTTVALKNLSVQRLVAHARTPLFRNGYALMLSAAATSGLGVVYWMLATRYYSAEVVGLNSAVISAMLLVAGVAQLSLVSVITRFLPRAGRATGRLVGSAYALTLTVAALAGLLFVLGVRLWSPALAFLGASPLFALWFVLATMAWCIFTLQDSVLAGMQQTVWVPIENTIFAIAKIALLLLFAWPAARYGIFASWTIPGAAVLLPISYLIFRRLLPRHAQASAAQAEPLLPRRIAGYAASNYIGSMLSLAVNTLLPLLVLHQLGPQANAYFAQPWLIASSLQLIAGNMAVSLTVEAATDRERLAGYARRALVHSARLLVPLVALMLIGAPCVAAAVWPRVCGRRRRPAALAGARRAAKPGQYAVSQRRARAQPRRRNRRSSGRAVRAGAGPELPAAASVWHYGCRDRLAFQPNAGGRRHCAGPPASSHTTGAEYGNDDGFACRRARGCARPVHQHAADRAAGAEGVRAICRRRARQSLGARAPGGDRAAAAAVWPGDHVAPDAGAKRPAGPVQRADSSGRSRRPFRPRRCRPLLQRRPPRRAARRRDCWRTACARATCCSIWRCASIPASKRSSRSTRRSIRIAW